VATLRCGGKKIQWFVEGVEGVEAMKSWLL
jgi:hypothetical protein